MNGRRVAFEMHDTVDCDLSTSKIAKGTGFIWLEGMVVGKVPL